MPLARRSGPPCRRRRRRARDVVVQREVLEALGDRGDPLVLVGGAGHVHLLQVVDDRPAATAPVLSRTCSIAAVIMASVGAGAGRAVQHAAGRRTPGRRSSASAPPTRCRRAGRQRSPLRPSTASKVGRIRLTLGASMPPSWPASRATSRTSRVCGSCSKEKHQDRAARRGRCCVPPAASSVVLPRPCGPPSSTSSPERRPPFSVWSSRSKPVGQTRSSGVRRRSRSALVGLLEDVTQGLQREVHLVMAAPAAVARGEMPDPDELGVGRAARRSIWPVVGRSRRLRR